MKLLVRYCKPYAWRMFGGLAIKILGTFTDLGLPMVLSYILDSVVPRGEIRPVFLWGGFMLFLAIATRWLNIVANRYASAVARDVTRNVRHDLFEKTMSLSGAQTDRVHIPSLISRMTSDTYNIHQVVGMIQRLGVRAPMILMGGIVFSMMLDPVITLVLVTLLPILGTLIFYISQKGIPLYGKVQTSVDSMVRIARENITGIRVIKALSKTAREKKRFEEANDTAVNCELEAGKVMSLSGPIMSLLLNIGLTLVVVVGAYRVNSGSAKPGEIIAFLSYFTMILTAVMMINRIFVVCSKATASANRIDEVLLLPKELLMESIDEIYGETQKEAGTSFETKAGAQVPHIEFRNVSFGYHAGEDGEFGEDCQTVDSEKYCVRNISFCVNHNESLGIIGATGSGKTTLLNLCMRFYDANEGEILIDGQNIKTIPLSELRSKFGVVFQNDVVFADTLEENICFGRTVTEEQMGQAARDACAEQFIMEKEEGFAHKAAIKGADLSGGQRQRLLISRALAGNPDILLLDDSSSALDYKTDATIRNNIRRNYKDTTTILVAQRASSVMPMTHILVLDEGKCIGYGTHEELMKNCPVYREIANLQMGDME